MRQEMGEEENGVRGARLAGSRATAQRFTPRLIRETVRLELRSVASK